MDNKFKPVPFWSWNDELDEKKLTDQIEWMHKSGIGGFFMHARGGLTTPYLGEKWFSCIDACLKKAKELNMEAYAYDENGWPSGFAGGKLLEKEEDRDAFLTYKHGTFDPKAYASFDISGDKCLRVYSGDNVLNVYFNVSVSNADILNKDTVKKFIELTHEKYKEADKYNNLRGFFTDEPQYQRWGHAYSRCMEQYFRDVYQMEIKDKIGLMFCEKEGYRDFRYKYWTAMQQLMLSAYAEQVYNWCETNGYKLTGHYVEESSLYMQMECNAGIMPFYAYEHIPGMDWLGRNIGDDLSPKQVGSVSAQLGKKQILTETYAMVGWDTTPEELKHIFEWQAVEGNVSLLCHHLLPYSEWGQRKRDYPEHYSAVNPWTENDFNLFNDEITKIGEKISTSHELVHVGVLHPIRSCYFEYTKDRPFECVANIQQSLAELLKILGGKHLPYHFIDETILARFGKVVDNTIVIGNYSYDTLILPFMLTMDENTEHVLKEFTSNGGKILLSNGKPSYVEGNPFDYPYLKSNITLDEIVKDQPFESTENDNIRISYREDDQTGKHFFYIVNLGEQTTISINGKHLAFAKWESRFVDEVDLKNDLDNNSEIVTLNKEFVLTKPVTNYLTLDTLEYSTDGVNYSNNLHHMFIFNKLLKERYNGTLYLKYSFDVKDIPEVCSALIENQHIIRVTVNDVVINKKGSVLEENLWEYDIASALKIGKNSIIVSINFYQNNDVYFALFGENVTESLVNCLAYPTTVEAIYLRGIFGVSGNLKDGKETNTVVGDNFMITKQPKNIQSLIYDGFPFFRGKIELEQTINVLSNDVILSIPERFSLIALNINGKDVGKFMFGHSFDISKYTKVGENIIKIILYVSNRNLLGPFHCADAEESLCVGPFSFERRGLWKDDGTSDYYRGTYSFVKTII